MVQMCDRLNVLFNGRVQFVGGPQELLASKEVRDHYLGGDENGK